MGAPRGRTHAFRYRFPGVRPEDVIGWLLETPPDALQQLLSITVPNSRQVRWRFAQVAKVFGVLRHSVDPRKINLQALLRKYEGTVVMEEVLSKLFHERMDVAGATDVLRGLQSGVLSIHVSALADRLACPIAPKTTCFYPTGTTPHLRATQASLVE